MPSINDSLPRPHQEKITTQPPFDNEKKSNFFPFSRPWVAAAVTGVALTVIAIFSPVIAITATLSLCLTGGLYAAVQYFRLFQENLVAASRAQSPVATPSPNSSINTDDSTPLSTPHTYNNVNNLLPVRPTSRPTTPVNDDVAPLSQEPLPQEQQEQESTQHLAEEPEEQLDSPRSMMSNNF